MIPARRAAPSILCQFEILIAKHTCSGRVVVSMPRMGHDDWNTWNSASVIQTDVRQSLKP